MRRALINSKPNQPGHHSLSERYKALASARTAGCEPACGVVWEGAGHIPAYAVPQASDVGGENR